VKYASESVRCGNCSQPIEGCDGRHGHWMHSLTRREHCAGGDLARPETPNEMTARHNRAKRAFHTPERSPRWAAS